MEYGYETERFGKEVPQEFICMICQLVARDPEDCKICGFIFCHNCISDWTTKNPTCPNRCKLQIEPIKGAIRKLYSALEIRCQNEYCKKMIPINEIAPHMKACKQPCPLHQLCGGKQDTTYHPFCTLECMVTDSLLKLKSNPKILYNRVEEILKKHVAENKSGKEVWSRTLKSAKIGLSDDCLIVTLKENSFVFRTVLGDIFFTSGVHYWELMPTPDSKDQAKMGVSLSKDFDFDTAFCNYNFGYAFYGNGSLRHGSNSEGKPFGQPIKDKGKVGILLDMQKGTLSFSFNDQPGKTAFTQQQLKKGPIYPALSILHNAGFIVRFGLQIPKWYKA